MFLARAGVAGLEGAFDLITMNAALYYVGQNYSNKPVRDHMLFMMVRLLKPGGMLWIGWHGVSKARIEEEFASYAMPCVSVTEAACRAQRRVSYFIS